jgi:hypothetical protein
MKSCQHHILATGDVDLLTGAVAVRCSAVSLVRAVDHRMTLEGLLLDDAVSVVALLGRGIAAKATIAHSKLLEIVKHPFHQRTPAINPVDVFPVGRDYYLRDSQQNDADDGNKEP